jgi:hypothetical protein
MYLSLRARGKGIIVCDDASLLFLRVAGGSGGSIGGAECETSH